LPSGSRCGVPSSERRPALGGGKVGRPHPAEPGPLGAGWIDLATRLSCRSSRVR
jgi:hypothetical protein